MPSREGYLDYNPKLKHRQLPEANKAAGKGNIEHPGQAINIVHQTRESPLTDYENRLGEALEKIFANDVVELNEIVNCLNEMGVQTPDGGSWTEQLFCSEMECLGA